MDDDIDIEEHDILEHPRIKNLFSDLSEDLKFDDNLLDVSDTREDNIQYNEEDPTTNEDEVIVPDYNINYFDIKLNISDSIEISDDAPEDIDQMDVKDESYEAQDLPPEDIYHYRNKIILGTKPPSVLEQSPKRDVIEQSPIQDVLEESPKQDRFNSIAIVLEDWKDRLANSQSFCDECGILFPTLNSYDDHRTTVHSLLVAVVKNVARKSTSKFNVVRNKAIKSTSIHTSTSICNHCNVDFKNPTALIKHLYELLPLKHDQCNKCDSVVKNKRVVADHKESKIKEKSVKMIQDSRDKIIFEDVPERDMTMEYFYLPKSVIFTCSGCNVHLLNCTGGWQHFNTGCKGPNVELDNVLPCKVCQRVYRIIDLPGHEKQHEFAERFKVYQLTKNLMDKVLTDCPKCNIYFQPYSLMKHSNSCGNIPTSLCSICNIHMPTSAYPGHKMRHDKQGMKRADFHFIQNTYTLINRPSKSNEIEMYKKRKVETERPLAKKIKLQPTNKTINSKPAPKHAKTMIRTELTQFVKKIKLGAVSKSSNKKVVSKPCNLKVVSSKIKGRTLGLMSKLKKGQMKKTMVYCQYCTGCYLIKAPKHVRGLCSRDEKLIVCDLCGVQLPAHNLRQHNTILHKHNTTNIHNINFVDMTGRPTCPTLPSYYQCQKCKIKFNSDTAMNQHVCEENYTSCNVCFQKFDETAYGPHIEYHKVINKLQYLGSLPILYQCVQCDVVADQYDTAVEHSHGHNCLRSKGKTIKCYICDLKFDNTSWSKHSNLHSQMSLDKTDFKILTFNPKDLLTVDWFDMFAGLKSSQKTEIIKSSLYSIERGVPMKLIKDGRIEYTLYTCSECQVCFENSQLIEHRSQIKCHTSRCVCTHCKLTFNDTKALTYHEVLHQHGVNLADIRIINFMKNSSDVQHLKSNVQKRKKKAKGKYLMYKCRDCGNCLLKKDSIQRHKCITKAKSSKCKQCNQTFRTSRMTQHRNLHAQNNKIKLMNKDNIKLVFFDSHNKLIKGSKPTKTVKIAKVYKCSCGLHFTTMASGEKHSRCCSTEKDIHSENCSKCGLLFPTDILVNHLCKHHSTTTKIKTITLPATTVQLATEYKVNITEAKDDHNTTNRATELPNKVESSTECSSKTDKKSAKYDHKIYKCGLCEACFLLPNNCTTHIKYSHRKNGKVPMAFPCNICGLKFSSMSKHKLKHHRKAFRLGRVLFVEYSLNKGKQVKKKKYIGYDKLQSYEVSSSMQE